MHMAKSIGLALALAAISAGALAQNPPAPAPAATEPPASAGPIAALQQELQQQGFAPGPVNGVMTEKTRRALAAYERRMRRPPEALAALGTTPEQNDPVSRAQAGLKRLGLFRGRVDGELGAQTRDAIIRFEASRHLPVDPRVSDRLLAELDQAGGGVGSTAAAAPATAPAAAPEPAAPAPAPAAPPPAPEATGRRPLPPGINPPPIR